MNIDLIKLKLKKMMSEERYKHSLNVSLVAQELALKYNCNVKKAEIAGLLHDCAKDLNYKTLKKIASECNIAIDEITQKIPKLLHPVVGMVIAEKEFDIKDSVILEAIKVHSTGSIHMSLLDKIIFLSDKIEPLRNLEGIEEIREIACKDLDQAVLMILDKGLLFLIAKSLVIHPISIEARNNILNKAVFT